MGKAIITFGTGYGFEAVYPFLRSCERAVPEADVFLYVGKNLRALREPCARRFPRVHLLPFRQSFSARGIAKVLRFLPAVRPAYARLLSFLSRGRATGWLADRYATGFVHFMVKRFFMIRRLLRRLPHDQVMITDLRDVLLQRDPFQDLGPKSIRTGQEPLLVRESDINMIWMRETFPPEIVRTLEDRPVACAGVTVGSRAAMVQYVEELLLEVYRYLDRIQALLGSDQAIHIRLFYQALEGLDKELEETGSGRIATLQYGRLEQFEVAGERLENRSGRPLAVVHQYDRHPELARQLLRAYSDADPLAAATQTPGQRPEVHS